MPAELREVALIAAGSVNVWGWYAAMTIAGLLIMGIHAVAEITGWGK